MGKHINALALAMMNARPCSTEQEVEIYLQRCIDWGCSLLHAQQMGIDATHYHAILYKEQHGVAYRCEALRPAFVVHLKAIVFEALSEGWPMEGSEA